jgi:threonylcarbamoyladenosine tRNA methylthiotransferase MtaB
VAFGGDIIAGFPTETEAMFRRSLDLVDECGLTQLTCFRSRRGPARRPRACRRSRRVVKDRARGLRDKGDAALRRHLDSESRRAPPRADRARRHRAHRRSSRRCGLRAGEPGLIFEVEVATHGRQLLRRG